MRRLLSLLPSLCFLLFCGCLLGCQTIVKNQSEVGFRWGTEVTFFSRAAETADEEATAELRSQPLSDYLARDPEPEVAGPPESAEPAGT